MKKKIGHTKRPMQPWNEYDYNESEYDWNGEDKAPEDEIEYAEMENIDDAKYAGTYEEEDAAYGDMPGYEGEDAAYEGEPEYGEEDITYGGSEEYVEEDDIYYEADGDMVYDTAREYGQDEYAEEDAEDPNGYVEGVEYAGDYDGLAEGMERAGSYDGYIEGMEYTGYPEDGGYAEDYDGFAEGMEYTGEYAEYSDPADYAHAEDGYFDSGEYMDMEDGYADSEEYMDAEDGYADSEEYMDAGDEYADLEEVYKQSGVNGRKKGFLAKMGGLLRNMDTMDKIMAVTGVGVLALAVITGGVFFSSYVMSRQIADFAEVGTQLEGITVIGEQGLMAVADAEMARIMAASAPAGEEEPTPSQDTDAPKEYDEREYGRQVTVNPDFTSIQKDLKIKFINKKTDKLVANVPFSVMVTGPDGKTYIWSDDDMDGIIYKKDIAAGTYQVVMETLADNKYSDYIIPTEPRSVNVKEEIAYVKVDVENEVKQETEVDVAHEDTKVNEVVVESVLQDTVPWLESKVISVTYNEVAKSTIADPATLVLSKGFMRMSANSASAPSKTDTNSSSGSSASGESSQESSEGSEPTRESSASGESSQESSEGSEPTQESSESGEPSENPSEGTESSQEPSESSEPTQSSSESPSSVPGKVTVEPAALTGAVGAKMTAKVTVSDFAEGGKMSYSISSDNKAVATASIDSSGNVSVTGVSVGKAELTVTAKCEVRPEGAQDIEVTEATAVINVTIADKLALTLDKDSATAFTDEAIVVNATVVNAAASEPALTAESSDTKIATVKVDKNVITITGIAAGSTQITVKYAENGQEVKATCTVTVKAHPKNDKNTKLKNLDGVQLYVKENETYREAVYADYYAADKFYIKGEVKYTGWQTLEGKTYYFNAEGEKITGEQIIQGAKYSFASDGALIVGTGEIGIDVSKWNGTIDWNAVKNSGISYVIIRCGYRGSLEGKLIEDSKFEANIKGATAAGLKVGIYFFSQAVDEVEAVEEASMVLAMIKNYTISYPIFLDVETSGGRGDNIDKATRTAVCKAFCQTIQNANYTAGIYSNKTWLETKLNAGELNAYKIWLAQYAAAPTYTGRHDMWQYRSTGSVSGISGNVDMNISYLGY